MYGVHASDRVNLGWMYRVWSLNSEGEKQWFGKLMKLEFAATTCSGCANVKAMEIIFNFLREIGACYKIWSVLKKRLCEMLLKIF